MEKIHVKSPEKLYGLRVVQDYDEMRQAMLANEPIMHWERGTSMSPMFCDGAYCRVEPLTDGTEIKAGDAVFCNVNGQLMVHMVWMVSNMNRDTPYFLIGSTSGSLYGWTSEIMGIAYATPYVEEFED